MYEMYLNGIFCSSAMPCAPYLWISKMSKFELVKMKILSIGEDGKISLSIKRALPPEKKSDDAPRRERKSAPVKQSIDSTYTWTPKKSEPASFEEMMNRFKQSSDEKFSDLKRKNPDANRTKRDSGAR